MMKMRKWLRKLVIIVGWLLVWQIVSLYVGNSILLVGPVETFLTMGKLLGTSEFWVACMGTCVRILFGFATGMLIGIFLAVSSARYRLLEEILAPVMTLIKAVPVASFVVIFLIWWGCGKLAAIISFCIVLPNMYINMLEGIKSTDGKLLEMARVFEIPGWNRAFYIYRPALKPFLDSAMKLAAGMSWKSGVAAEVIGLPKYAIGEQLYMSKIYLDTAGVLAWTLVCIFLSAGFEKLILFLWKKFCLWEPECRAVPWADETTVTGSKEFADGYESNDCIQAGSTGLKDEMPTVKLREISKAYGEKKVLDRVNAEYLAGNIYCLNSPSGSGKTTLFRVLAGLEKWDAGELLCNARSIAFLFQEDRLCEEYSALKNIEMVTGNRETAEVYLLQLLEEQDIHKPCKELSGGMKRRVAIARTMAASADLILLDEPYNGLDAANRVLVQKYIEKYGRRSILLIASHFK